MARMKRKYKVFIAVGIVLNLVICLGLYVNYRLDHLVAGLNRPGVLYRDKASQPEEYANDSSLALPGSSAQSPGTKTSTNTLKLPTPSPGSLAPEQISPPSKQDIANGVEQKLGRPVEKKDLIAAGMIVMHKLNWDEITFLYNAGSKSNPSPEELKQAREILKAKLSQEELATLKAMGGKYGQGLNFLN